MADPPKPPEAPPPQPPRTATTKAKADRETRLAQALRANLRRRKTAARDG